MALGSLVVKIVGDNSQFNKTIAQTQTQLNKSTRELQTVARSMTSVGDSMTKGVTLPIMAVGAVLAKVGTEFDDAYDKIRIGTGATGKALEGLETDFKEVAKDSASSFDDISTAVADLNTRLGLSGKPLQDMAKKMANFARITETDINTLIPVTTRVFGDWAIATEDQSEALDFMFRATQNTGISIDNLAQKAVQFGAPLRQMGFDFEKSIALLGKWEKEGVNTETVLAGLKIGLANFAKEGVQDTNAALIELIDKVKNAGSVGEATGIAMEVFGSRAGPDMAAAIREGRFDLETLLEQLKNGTDTINGVAEATDDWKEKLQKLKNETMIQLEPVANKVFDSIGRSVEKVSPKIEELTKWFGSLTEEQTDNILKWGLLLAAIGPVLSIAGRTTTGIIQLKNSILLLNKAIMASPILMGTAATAAVALLGWATDKAGDSVDNLSDSIGNKLGATAIRTIIPIGQLKQGIEENIAVAKALKEGYLSADEAAHINIFTIDKYLKLIEKRKAAEENLTEKEIPSYIEAISQKDSSENINIITLKEHKKVTENTTESIEEEKQAIDELRSSFNALISDLFDGINANNELQESQWALEEAQKAVNEAAKEYGINSIEYEKAINGLDSANQDYLISLNKVYTSVWTTKEEQEAARLKAIDFANELYNTGTIGKEAYELLSQQFSVTKDDIVKLSDDIITKLKEVDGVEVRPAVDLDTTAFNDKLMQIRLALSRLNATTSTIEGSGLTFNYAKGGLVGFSDGGIINKVLSASAGMITPSYDNGGILSLLHKNEVVLNAGQTKNLAELIFGLANTRFSGSQEYGDAGAPITINNVIELDGSIIYEKTEEHLYRSQRLKQIGAGIR